RPAGRAGRSAPPSSGCPPGSSAAGRWRSGRSPAARGGYRPTRYPRTRPPAAVPGRPPRRFGRGAQPTSILLGKFPKSNGLIDRWPGSVVEYLALVDPLAAAGYHVVVPSLPGFGYSTPLAAAGWDHARIAAGFVALMDRLGYRRFGAAGSDWGAIISREIGR